MKCESGTKISVTDLTLSTASGSVERCFKPPRVDPHNAPPITPPKV